MATENRAWILRDEGLQRFKAVITRGSKLSLQDILAMPEEAQIELAMKYFAEGMTSRLIVMLAGEYIHTPAVKYPANWKEAFREQFFPHWLLKRFPIRYKHVVFRAEVVYPKVKLPEEEHKLVAVDIVELEPKDPLALSINFASQVFQ